MCVLLVEDEFLIALLLQDALQDAGFEVIVAENSLKAVELLEQKPGHFSVFITDYNMPGGMNGGDLAQHVRAIYPDIPMILATARLEILADSRWERLHMEVVPKPYTPNEIIRRIQGRTA